MPSKVHSLVKTNVIDLYTSMRSELLNFVKGKIKNPQDAEDIVQQTFLQVVDLDDATIREINNLRNYIFGMTNNMALSHLRKQKRYTETFTPEENTVEQEELNTAPENVLDSEQRVAVIEAAVARMPATMRQVFLYYRYRNMSMKDIENDLQMSRAAVQKNIVRALAFLRDSLAEESVS